MIFLCKCPHCKLVPVQNWEYEYDLLQTVHTGVQWMVSAEGKLVFMGRQIFTNWLYFLKKNYPKWSNQVVKIILTVGAQFAQCPTLNESLLTWSQSKTYWYQLSVTVYNMDTFMIWTLCSGPLLSFLKRLNSIWKPYLLTNCSIYRNQLTTTGIVCVTVPSKKVTSKLTVPASLISVLAKI